MALVFSAVLLSLSSVDAQNAITNAEAEKAGCAVAQQYVLHHQKLQHYITVSSFAHLRFLPQELLVHEARVPV